TSSKSDGGLPPSRPMPQSICGGASCARLEPRRSSPLQVIGRRGFSFSFSLADVGATNHVSLSPCCSGVIEQDLDVPPQKLPRWSAIETIGDLCTERQLKTASIGLTSFRGDTQPWE